MEKEPPYEWRDFIQWEHASVRDLGTWLLSLSQEDLADVQERMEALRQLAASGEIEAGNENELGPCSVDPVIWELKWTFFGQHIRQYHAEPTSHPDLLVSLHMHTKPQDTSTPAIWQAVRERQDQEMSHAKLRYLAGQRSEWTT